jgi:truncated hemoglobin YjbI
MSIYDAIGGMGTCQRLAAAFYARVENDAVLRPVYPRSLHCAVESIALFLAEYFGGPCEYSERRSWLSMYDAHLRFKIGQSERDAWLNNMMAALDDVGIAEPARGALAHFFEEASTHLINRPPAEQKATPFLPFDEAVAAVRRRDFIRLDQLAEHPEFHRNRAAWVGLLGLMAASEDSRMIDYALARVSADPRIADEKYGRTLLHLAAGEGCLPMVELLLRHGADPNAEDGYGHPPLYYVGNSCRRESGAEVVRVLARGGADVNQRDRVKRCAPLHMAARRGNVRVAAALLECGADPAIPDIAGVTPLQRAINCRKPAVAELLRSWEAGSRPAG